MENKKTKAKYCYQTNKRTSRKIMKKSQRSFWWWKKNKKRYYATNRNKNMSDKDREKKIKYEKLLLEKKTLLKNLINRFKKIENVSLKELENICLK